MRIRNNMAAMNVRRNQNQNNKKISSSLEKLSSGYAINRAADDAAGLAISEKMRAQIAGLDTAVDNCKQGINLFQVADGALGDVTDILQRMNELCIKAGNEVYGDEERQAIQAEIDSLMEEVGRISETTNYNNIPLLKFPPRTTVDMVFIIDTTGSMSNMIQDVSSNLNDYVTKLTDRGINVRLGLVDYRDFGANEAHTVKKTDFTEDLAEFGSLLSNLGVGGGGDGPEAGLEAIMDGAFSMDFHPYSHKAFVLVTDAGLHKDGDHLDGFSDVKPYQYTLTEVAEKLKEEDVNFTLVGNNHADTKALTNLAGGRYIQYSDTFSDNLMENADELADKLADRAYYDLPLQIGDTAEDLEKFRLWEVTPGALNIHDVAVDPLEKLYESLAKVKAAINDVSSVRGQYGAYVNRLEHTLEALGVNLENLSDAESLIRDTDMADEMTELTKQNILSQASQAMLSQANQSPQGVLQLLK